MSMHRDGGNWSLPGVPSRTAASGRGVGWCAVAAAAPWAMVLVLAVMLCAGCGGSPANPQVERPSTADPVEYFRQTQANTITPNGRTLMDTVRQTGPNLLCYQTEDGCWFEIRYHEVPTGGFRYYDARQIAPPVDGGSGSRGG